MRRLRLGAALDAVGLTPATAAWAAAGIPVAAVAIGAYAALAHRRFEGGAFASAAAAWAAFVVFVLAVDEFWETLTDRREPDGTRPDQRGWRRWWVPLGALVFGVTLGYVAWR